MQQKWFQSKFVCYVAVVGLLAGCGGGESTGNAQMSGTRLLAGSTSTTTAADYTDALQRIYVGYFGRPADPAGLAYFAQLYQAAGAPTTIDGITRAYGSNTALKSLIDSFATSAESQALYPGDNATFISAIYKNLFNRAAEPEGVAYWAAMLDKGAITRANAALQIMNGAMSTDRQSVDNKIAVAKAYTTGLDSKALTDAYSGLDANATVRAMLGDVSYSTDPTAFATTVERMKQRLLGTGPVQTTPGQTYLGQAYQARNGLFVTIDSIETSDQGTQYKNYTVNYTQTNNTTAAIDEATFKMYFATDAALPQYGFFDKVYPGVPVHRSYTFTVPAASKPTVLEYDADNFFRSTPTADSLKWTFPITTASAGAGSLSLMENSLFGDTRDAFPYSSTMSFNQMLVGVKDASIGDYKLAAQGGSFTIVNLSAKDTTGAVTPTFSGLANGQVIKDGTMVSFSLRTPLTGGRVVSLTYAFTVKETGQMFLVNATGKTN